MTTGLESAMKTSFYVLNLTSPERTITTKLIGVAKSNEIRTLSDIPGAEEAPGRVVLYVVGHAVPNGLIGASGAVLPEADVATAIQKRRGYAPTLIVWDVCFAKTLLEITGAAPWTDNFVHVFSCQSYERTWHLGPASRLDSSEERPTMFSMQLTDAVRALGSGASWEMLESELRKRLSPIQRPEITPKPSFLQPADFELERLVGAGSTSSAQAPRRSA
jgi:hypothetical protein